MSNRYASVAYGGLDVHYKFSNVTLRDAGGRVVAREKLASPGPGCPPAGSAALAAWDAPGAGGLGKAGAG